VGRKAGRKIRSRDAKRFYVELGRIIQRERVKRGLTQKELATETRLHRVTIAKCEGGVGRSSMSVILRIAEAMELPDLLSRAERLL